MADHKGEQISLRDDLAALPFLLPFLAVFAVFIGYPVFYSFYISLHSTGLFSDWYDRFGTMAYVGFKNYHIVLTDKLFWWSVVRTFQYALLTIFPSMALSLFLALLLNKKIRGLGIFRSGFFLPNVFDVYVVGVIWLFLYNPNGGFFVTLASKLGFNELAKDGFLNNPNLTLPCIALAMVLKGAGFGMVLFLTALNNISDSIFEAADVDGATYWQKLWHIIIPLLKPIILFLSITGLTGTLNAFGEIYAMTDGTGGASTTFLGTTVQSGRISGFHLFKTFDESNYGGAAAISFILLGIALVISWLNFKFLSSKD